MPQAITIDAGRSMLPASHALSRPLTRPLHAFTGSSHVLLTIELPGHDKDGPTRAVCLADDIGTSVGAIQMAEVMR